MSQQSRSLFDQTFNADGAVRAARCVGFDGAEATLQGQKVAGVAQYAAADEEDFGVALIGTVVVESGAAIDVGESLICDGQGRAIPTTGALEVGTGVVAVLSSAASGGILEGGDLPEYVFADALQAASGAGEFIEVLLRR
jgi:hypothetical protein